MNYDPNYLDPTILKWTTERIKEKFELSDPESQTYAEKALLGIEGHGGNNKDKEEIEEVLDVVVATWIKISKD